MGRISLETIQYKDVIAREEWLTMELEEAKDMHIANFSSTHITDQMDMTAVLFSYK